MATPEDVKKLAALARIAVDDASLESFAKEFDGILAYVGKIEELSVTATPDLRPPVRNVFRKDDHSDDAGVHTERLIAQFPEKEGNSLKVKQIVQYD